MQVAMRTVDTKDGERQVLELSSKRKPMFYFIPQLCRYQAPSLVKAHMYVVSNGKTDFVK